MKGYLKNPVRDAEKAFAGGWFHSGDLAVMDPDGYMKIKDRSKDIIISGGENISLDRGRGRALPASGRDGLAAVVARPDPKLGRDTGAPLSSSRPRRHS